MNENLRMGLLDELSKISGIDLRGLGPENMMSGAPPEPMPTPGFDKAQDILGRAQQMKTAAPLGDAYGQGVSQSRELMRPNQNDSKSERNVKSFGAHLIGGMGIGRMVTEFAHGPHVEGSHKAKWYGMAAGGAIGLGDYAAHRYARHKRLKASMEKLSFSPGMALKATSQVGKVATKVKVGPSLRRQVGASLVGRKFSPSSI